MRAAAKVDIASTICATLPITFSFPGRFSFSFPPLPNPDRLLVLFRPFPRAVWTPATSIPPLPVAPRLGCADRDRHIPRQDLRLGLYSTPRPTSSPSPSSPNPHTALPLLAPCLQPQPQSDTLAAREARTAPCSASVHEVTARILFLSQKSNPLRLGSPATSAHLQRLQPIQRHPLPYPPPAFSHSTPPAASPDSPHARGIRRPV